MGIDGIGRGSGVPPSVDSAVGSVGTATGDKFELGLKQVDRAGGAELLEQVQRGEVGLDQYLQTRVDDAVRHLESTLTTEQLSFVKQELLEQLKSDPVLIELVRRTTGQSPEATEP
jgi:hypothetical protein